MKEFKDAIVQTTTKVIWSLSHVMPFVYLCVVIFLFSCSQDKTEESNLLLGENEFCFNEKLVSITRNGEYYYIGTESSGKVFVYSTKEGDVIDTLNTDYGRIYQVKKNHETDTFFVGTQNMGLKKTHQHGDSLITDIPYKIKGKGDRYSCYDIFFDNDTVYAMTSHGIFKVGKSDTLDSIFTHTDSNGVPNPLVANNMVKASGYLFAATDSGVVVIKNHEVVDTIAEKIKIKNVAYHNNFIYTLGDCLYKINPASLEVVDTVKLKASARYYFHADSIHHFLSDSYMVLAHDSVLHKPEQHKQVNTRRKLSLEGHNVIADGKEYSLLVAENALWQVGHHYPSVFGNLKKEGGVKLACTDGKSAYFLVGKKVYKLGANNVAEEVLELKENGEIRLMECNLNGDSIYYVNNGDSVFRQSLKQGDSELIGKSDKEITAMCVHNSVGNGVILGVRDGLLYMEKQKIPEPITLEMNNGNKDTIPYIRRFAVTESNYYVPTMNEGIFFGKGKSLTFLGDTRSIQSIRDVVCPNPDNAAILFWLTNKYLYLSRNDSVPNINYGSRLFVSHLDTGMVVCIPGEIRGMRVLRLNENHSILKDTILFSDMAYRPESSLRLNDKLFLGGQSGIIAFNAKEIFDEKKSLNYNYVEFKDKEKRQSFVIYLPFLAVLIIVIICYVRYRVHKVKIKEIKRKRDKLNSILEGNAGAAEEFNDKFKGINEETNKSLLFLIFVKEKKLNDISNDLDSLNKQVQDYLNNESINKKVGERVRGQIERLKQRSNGIESQLNNDGGAADKFQTELESICTSIAEIQEKSPETVSDDELNEISNDLVNLNNRVHEYQNIKIKEIKQHALNESETFKRKTKELYISLNRLDDAKKYISNEQLRNEIEELKEQLSNYEVGLDDELKNHIQSTTGSVTWYLIERISDQINKIEKVDERSNLIEDSKSAIEQKDIEILLDVIRHNEEKLKEASQKNNKSKLNIEKNNPSSNKPRQTMTFKLKSGMAMHHVDYLYQILVTEEKWIEGSQGDFRDLFSNESNEIWLTWKGIYGKGTLVEMFKEFVGAGLITVAKGFTIPAILEGHFKDDNSKWLTGLDKGNKVNEKAKPIIEKCVNVLKQRLKIDRDNYDDDEDFQSKYDSYDHQDLNLHKR